MSYQSKPTCWRPPLFWGIPRLCCRAWANPSSRKGKELSFQQLFVLLCAEPAPGFPVLVFAHGGSSSSVSVASSCDSVMLLLAGTVGVERNTRDWEAKCGKLLRNPASTR